MNTEEEDTQNDLDELKSWWESTKTGMSFRSRDPNIADRFFNAYYPEISKYRSAREELAQTSSCDATYYYSNLHYVEDCKKELQNIFEAMFLGKRI